MWYCPAFQNAGEFKRKSYAIAWLHAFGSHTETAMPPAKRCDRPSAPAFPRSAVCGGTRSEMREVCLASDKKIKDEK